MKQISGETHKKSNDRNALITHIEITTATTRPWVTNCIQPKMNCSAVTA